MMVWGASALSNNARVEMVVPNNRRLRCIIIVQLNDLGSRNFSHAIIFYSDWRGSRKFRTFVARDIASERAINFWGATPRRGGETDGRAGRCKIKQTTL
jgi:hypothetical protein